MNANRKEELYTYALGVWVGYALGNIIIPALKLCNEKPTPIPTAAPTTAPTGSPFIDIPADTPADTPSGINVGRILSVVAMLALLVGAIAAGYNNINRITTFIRSAYNRGVQLRDALTSTIRRYRRDRELQQRLQFGYRRYQLLGEDDPDYPTGDYIPLTDVVPPPNQALSDTV